MFGEKKLDNISDKYIIAKRNKNRKEMSNICAEGEKLIYDTKTYYEKQISAPCKKKKDVVEAWRGYTIIMEAFKKMTNNE